jgi:hypothetical protein
MTTVGRGTTGLRARSSGVAILLILAFAGVTAGAGQGSRKLDKDQEREGQALVQIVKEVGAGQAAPADFAVTWDNHFLRARDGTTYLPFTVTLVDSASVSDPSLAVLVRVVPKGQAPVSAAAVAPAKDEKKTDPNGPFLYFVDAKPAQAGQPFRFRRALQLKPGEYDVYVAMKQRSAADKPDAKPKTTVLKQAITVPSFAGTDFGLSSVIVAEKADALTTPPTAEQQGDRPYAIGLMDLVPATRQLTKTQELTVYYQIYNPAVDAGRKPDLRFDYTFYRRQEGGDRALGTETQVQNAATLAPQFEVGKFLLFECRAWALTPFPVGEYRLEIKVTDKLSGKAITENVGFTVGS